MHAHALDQDGAFSLKAEVNPAKNRTLGGITDRMKKLIVALLSAAESRSVPLPPLTRQAPRRVRRRKP